MAPMSVCRSTTGVGVIGGEGIMVVGELSLSYLFYNLTSVCHFDPAGFLFTVLHSFAPLPTPPCKG